MDGHSEQIEIVVDSEASTERLGRAMAAAIAPGLSIALIGPLGAGKTRFVRSFAEACGVPPDAVTSPTYILCQEYAADHFTVYHLDMYRLTDESEFLDLGMEELFSGNGVTLIEWADRVLAFLPDDRLEVAISVTGESARKFHFRGCGSDSAAVVQRLRREIKGDLLPVADQDT